MRFTTQTLVRSGFVAGFLVVCLVLAGYFYTSMGGRIPVIAEVGDYHVSFLTNDIDNLLDDADVTIAGVVVGKVSGRTQEGSQVRVQLTIQPQYAPLHQGATLRIGVKSLVGASDVTMTDGQGPELSDGATLPADAVGAPVQVHDVIAGLSPPTRTALGGTIQSLGAGTAGQAGNIDQLMQGVGKLANGGVDALDAIAKQGQDLKALSNEATGLLNDLDTGQGRIAQVVSDADTLTRSTAGQKDALASTVRQLPGTLDSARTATGKLQELSGSLAPIASDLNKAAPDLNRSLVQLPGVTSDLRGLLPSLNGVLDRAPATLDRVPTLGGDVRGLVPPTQTMLQDANPLLAYAAPYGRDVGAMLESFGSTFENYSENGLHTVRLAPIVNQQAVRNIPLPTSMLDPTNWHNPYPRPGSAGAPAPFGGPYPRVAQAPR
ncbi:MCE family protein [Actinomycetospora endophytica]|uniref:MCE family protein n=1 Tax=Actinomycetospora endophytica TaxID=2291215 RepID=A0ABS8P8K5_9PSEU|nr:MlaD family protein [Actinomycetospora endophytica]MCD2194571.1 MCE family protein [Actinomycetospora endophytica]